MYLQNYHKHTSYSHRYNKDSPVTHMDYIKYYGELAKQGIPTIYSTVEHGWQSPYFRIYDDLDKFNKKMAKDNPNYVPIKFVFGTEGYWVKDRFEKDSSNCHIVLLAKNENGRKKINRIIYDSFKSGYYYKNRMDLDLLLQLPKDDVMVTTACCAFWNKYDDIDDIVLKLNKHFTSFYLEVQAHDTSSQKLLNNHIIDLHRKYNIPIIAGLDSHVITPNQMEDRDYLLKSSGVNYEDESGWYMDLPSVDELINRFHNQGILSEVEINEAIENTNVCLEFDDIILDRSIKVPVAKRYQGWTQEQRNNELKRIVNEEWIKQYNDMNLDKLDEYYTEIRNNINEVLACNMADYFLDDYWIMKRGIEKYGGILTPSGRGSGVSFFLNKLLGFTKVDKVNADVLMYAERFLTATRILESHTPPDIDMNVSDREPFIKAQIDELGEDSTFDLLACGTLKYKSAFKMFARANNVEPSLADEVSKQITTYEEALKHKEEDEEINIYDYVDKEKYGYLIEGCQAYRGIIDNLKAHPCGTIAYNHGNVIEDVGVIMVKSESQGDKAKEIFVAVIESHDIDSFGILKNDFLIVDSIGLTYDIYKELGMKPMSVNELMIAIKDDKPTWDIYKNGLTMCINQVEQTKSTEKVMRYQPKNIAELTQFVAAIRPSFQSMYKIFERREHFDYGIKAFDSLIQDEFCDSSFILYQEHLMKVLGFAEFPMGETYTIIKAISKKKTEVIAGANEKFLPNFSKAILDTKETEDKNVADQSAKKVWKVIEDSAAYGFNSAHAYSMAIDSVTLAWLKAHYPLAFYKVCLQRYTDKGDKNKVIALKAEMNKVGIKLNPIKFGDDNRTFTINEDGKSINQTIQSLKNVQKVAPQILYKMGQKNYPSLFHIFKDLKLSVLNKKSLDIIFKLDYFSEYGDINYILQQWEVYNKVADIYEKIKTAKKLTKTTYETYFDISELAKYGKETAKQITVEDSEGLYRAVLMEYPRLTKEIEKSIPYTPITQLEKMVYQCAYNGACDIVDENQKDNIFIVSSVEENKYGTPFITMIQCNNGQTITFKGNKRIYLENKCESGDVIMCYITKQPKRVMNENDEWVDTGEEEVIIKDYAIVRKFEMP